ncbi:MAG: LytTR family DNA-binding domain-containing protein [Ferruginibacter sp.]
MIEAIIIDDELNNINSLQNLLTKFCPQINITGTATNAKTGFELIKKINPQLAFLDIEMPFGNAFDLLNRLQEIRFEIIFVTAFDQYAIKAFKYAAIDYLLKPINIDELIKAVDKVKAHIDNKNTNEKVTTLLHNIDPNKINNPKIAIAELNGVTFIYMDTIVRMEAQKNYTVVYVNGGTKIMATKNLGSFEEFLPEKQFCRIHHSHIVNLAFIKKYNNGRGGHIEMEDGTEIEVSVRKRDSFLERFKN